MAKELHEAENLAEFIELLKSDQGDSNTSLGAKIGIASTTIHRLLHGGKADDETLDKLADYAGVTREWMYSFAKGIQTRPRYSRTVSILAAMLEQAPPEVAEEMLVLARALIEARKKKDRKVQKPDAKFSEG